jgi:hypothetical protein
MLVSTTALCRRYWTTDVTARPTTAAKTGNVQEGGKQSERQLWKFPRRGNTTKRHPGYYRPQPDATSTKIGTEGRQDREASLMPFWCILLPLCGQRSVSFREIRGSHFALLY